MFGNLALSVDVAYLHAGSYGLGLKLGGQVHTCLMDKYRYLFNVTSLHCCYEDLKY